MGLYGIALARENGARTVIGIDSVQECLEIAKTFGADQVFDVSEMSPEDLVAAVRDFCPPDGADVIIGVCGGTQRSSLRVLICSVLADDMLSQVSSRRMLTST